MLKNIFVNPQSFEFLPTKIRNNIYNHLKFQNTHVMFNNILKIVLQIFVLLIMEFLFRNFENKEFGFKNDVKGILGAINETSNWYYETGFSGRGFNRSTQIATLRFKEHILIISREGICYVDKKGTILYKINKNLVKGTFVDIRINEKN